MNKKNLYLVLIVLFSILGVVLLGNIISMRANGSGLSRMKAHGKVDELLSIINSQYVDTVNTKEMTEELMTDLASKLDPHSVYIPASDLADVNSFLQQWLRCDDPDDGRCGTWDAMQRFHCGQPGSGFPGLKGDLNGDCKVDIKDFTLLGASWLSCDDPQGCP